MIYKGEFEDINNTVYTIKITTNGDTSSTSSLVLGGTPIITEIETSDNHLYKPCKYSSATISLVSNDYMFDIYSSTAQQNKVELLEGNTVRWVGYTTPNLYSMGYECKIEEIEIEAIDGLSTLQYYKYAPISGVKRIVKLIDIIDYLIDKCNCYTNYYISHNMVLSSGNNQCIASKLEISEQNFFDEDDDPMTMQEVLEEICKYLNVSCVADGSNVYFLDYDAIKNGINSYYKFSVGSTSGTVVTLSQNKEITSDDYSENGGVISLDNVYNKAIVESSLYSFDDAIPDIFDDKDIINYGTNQSYTQNLTIEDNEGKGGKHKCFYRFYKNPNYKSTYYEYSYYTLTPIAPPSTIDYSFIQNYIGATIVRGYFKKVDDFDDDINDLKFTDYLLIHSHDSNQTTGDSHYLPNMTVDNELGLPVFESIIDVDPAFIGGDNVYFVIKGNYLQMDREKLMYIPEGYSNKDDNFDKKYLWLKAKLEFDGYYWNGSNWTTTDTCFKLEFSAEDTSHHINKSFPIKNTINWELGLNTEGYAIPLPRSIVSTTRPKITLYTPHRMSMDYRCDAVWLKNFGIELHIANRDLDAENDSDTEYSNVINTDFVNEMDEEEFKICTWDNKKPNYSALAYKSGNYYYYIDTIYNKSTGHYLRCEEHLIERLVNQYSDPSVILTLNLKNNIKLYSTLTDNHLPNKVFVVDYITTDWRYNKSEVKLIEKK